MTETQCESLDDQSFDGYVYLCAVSQESYPHYFTVLTRSGMFHVNPEAHAVVAGLPILDEHDDRHGLKPVEVPVIELPDSTLLSSILDVSDTDKQEAAGRLSFFLSKANACGQPNNGINDIPELLKMPCYFGMGHSLFGIGRVAIRP